jgi:hypothetical protein
MESSKKSKSELRDMRDMHASQKVSSQYKKI